MSQPLVSSVHSQPALDGTARVRRRCPIGTPVEDLGPTARAMLKRLRLAARRARCGRHLTLQAAHDYLACPGAASGATEAVVRTLGEVLDRRPVFFAPENAQASFDEAWLMRCFEAQRCGDVDSLAFLVGRRVAAPLRRPFLDLLRAL